MARHTAPCTPIPSKRDVGIELLKADDFVTWWFSIEVMGESLYQVRAIQVTREREPFHLKEDTNAISHVE